MVTMMVNTNYYVDGSNGDLWQVARVKISYIESKAYKEISERAVICRLHIMLPNAL
jgi:hypothetical protein